MATKSKTAAPALPNLSPEAYRQVSTRGALASELKGFRQQHRDELRRFANLFCSISDAGMRDGEWAADLASIGNEYALAVEDRMGSGIDELCETVLREEGLTE